MARDATSTWSDLLGGVISESHRIVAAHSRHFLALSVLFLLPFSSILVAAPSFFFTSAPSTSSLFFSHRHRLPSLAPPVLFSFAALFLLSASAAISGSAHHGFYGRPVKILPALRSLPARLAHLTATLAAALLPLATLFLLLASLLLLSLKALTFLHLPPRLSPFLYSIFAAFAFLALLHLHLTYFLAGVIAILESSWGFAPLRRSAYLIKGMRPASLCLNLFFAVAIGLTLWGCAVGNPGSMAAAAAIARTVFATGITAALLLYWMVAAVVAYMYCKALHGELAGEIAEEFAWEYVSLPFHDRSVPHAVSVIRR
ncbi:uncharacterized protein LOC122002049 [Zingiber officinale]|uniref:Uncharacterized protein n=1 Tax=Zingiber officinale TaxID=94328 RepID=A0A8J5FT88_ZINOF|nr:uncharacterized protein LOC122002049 [Zingiber officinale]KAG6493419.1 hypothetical protein ZIOFF_048402 [Zingiber officinale]